MNANAQWVSYTLPYSGIPFTLGFYDLNRGVSFGHSISPFNEYIFYTTNSGLSWIQAAYPVELRAIADVQYINENIIYACGAETVAFSSNTKTENDFLSFPKNIRDRLLIEGRTEFFSEYKSAFIKSTNGGQNWQRASQFDTTTGYIIDIHFFNVNTGYALIDSGSSYNSKFCKTTNGGANWQFISSVGSPAEVERMIFLDMNTGIAKGFYSGGHIYKTTNAGLNWSNTYMPTQIDGITFFNSTTGIAIGITNDGASNNVYKTTNAGDNWNIINTFTGPKLYNNLVSLPNTGTAFAIGNNIDTVMFLPGKITTLKTTNWGLNWVSAEFEPKLMAYGLALVDSDNFFIGAGDIMQAQILKSTNGGNVFVNQIGTNLPSSFSLSQNYPNPFNPKTVISFQLPRHGGSSTSDVIIKVYDVQGREVETLVNERLQAGTYQTQWDAAAFPSGVYFYRIQAGDFRETKRMMLIK